MDIVNKKERQGILSDIKLSQVYFQFGEFLREVEKKNLSQKIITSINHDVQELNDSLLTGNELRNLVKSKQRKLIKELEKEHKIVPKNHYRNIWLPVGMSAFGLPIGVVFGTVMGNMALLAVGLPIGMVIGMISGSNMDKKAAKEGRQLNIEIK